jgi:hypothetical protein
LSDHRAGSRCEISTTRARGEHIDQRVGFDLVGGIEIGIPFVEQIDPGIGIPDDFLERFELTFAGGKAEFFVHRFADDDFTVVVIILDIDRHDAAGEAEGEPIGRRPVIGALAQFRLQAGEQR